MTERERRQASGYDKAHALWLDTGVRGRVALGKCANDVLCRFYGFRGNADYRRVMKAYRDRK